MEPKDQYTERTREVLYAEVWAEPMTKVAQRYGLSDRGLAKICARMGIPVPGRGCWAQRQVGRVSPQPKLPAIKPGQQAIVVVSKGGHDPEKTSEFEEGGGAIDVEKQLDHQIVVSKELLDPHPLVAKTAKSLGGARANENGIVRPRAKRCLDVRVGIASIEVLVVNPDGGLPSQHRVGHSVFRRDQVTCSNAYQLISCEDKLPCNKE